MFLTNAESTVNIFIRTRIQISCKSNSIEFYTHIQIVFGRINIKGFRKVSIGYRDGGNTFVMFVICLYFPINFITGSPRDTQSVNNVRTESTTVCAFFPPSFLLLIDEPDTNGTLAVSK